MVNIFIIVLFLSGWSDGYETLYLIIVHFKCVVLFGLIGYVLFTIKVPYCY
jgi:hypothetical protein